MGQLRDYCRFDHEFFGQTESDSLDMGPQARMLFEVVYEALFDAGKQNSIPKKNLKMNRA